MFKTWKTKFVKTVKNDGIRKFLGISALIQTINVSFSISNDIVLCSRKMHTLEKLCRKCEPLNFQKLLENKKKDYKNSKHIKDSVTKYCPGLFLSAESSTSSLGGNKVDGLPPASSAFLFFLFHSFWFNLS